MGELRQGLIESCPYVVTKKLCSCWKWRHEDIPISLIAVPCLPPAALKGYEATLQSLEIFTGGKVAVRGCTVPSESLVMNYCFGMGFGIAVPPPCNTKLSKNNSNQSGFAGKSHSFNPRGSPNVSAQSGYSNQQTGTAFPILLQKCVGKGNVAPKAFTYIMELHLIWLL